eukprot:763614-Hanusia_phi.AAC.3
MSVSVALVSTVSAGHCRPGGVWLKTGGQAQRKNKLQCVRLKCEQRGEGRPAFSNRGTELPRSQVSSPPLGLTVSDLGYAACAGTQSRGAV